MHNQITVIPSATIIIVAGTPLHFPFTADAAITALHWQNGRGSVTRPGGSEKITGEADYTLYVAPFAALWEAEKARREAANAPA